MQKALGAQPLLILAGPTASGKSALAMQLAETLGNVEILCADSITVYRGFEIGSAKPSQDDQKKIPHHLIDLCESTQNFTAGDFVRHALPLIESLQQRNKIPILVGGTGFYLRALLKGMASSDEDEKRALEVRQIIEVRAQNEGWEKLYSELLKKDPDAISTVHQNDHYRILRALQAMELSGKLWSAANRDARASAWRFPDARFFCLRLEKEELRQRIEARTKIMLENGLLLEVRGLLARGVEKTAKPMLSVGYRECVQCIDGEFPEADLAQKIILETTKLTKRQMTWFRGEEGVEWLEKEFLSHLKESLMIN